MNQFSLTRKSLHTCWLGIGHIRIILLCFVLTSAAFIVGCAQKANDPEIWYIWRNGSSAEIRLLSPTDRQERVIVRSETRGNILSAALSPDGKHVAYIGDDPAQGTSIWLTDTDGSNPTRITQGSESALFSWLDNNSLLISYGGWIQGPVLPRLDFYAYDVSKQTMIPVVVEGDQADLFRCALNKSSYHPEIVVQSNNQQPALARLELRSGVIKIATDFAIDLSGFPELTDAQCLSWTSNGEKVILQGTSVLLKRENLFLASNQGRSVTRLTDFGKDFKETTFSSYAISPDARWVVAVGDLLPRPLFGLSGAATLVLVSTDTKKVEFMGLPDLLGPDRLVWSPDSQYIAITAPKVFDQMTDNQIYIIDIAKKENKQLTNDSGAKEVFDWR